MATKVNLRELATGERVKAGDVIIEVVDNPQDGMWIRGKYVSVPGNPALEGTEDQIFAADITERA
jgi:hypothetical protein